MKLVVDKLVVRHGSGPRALTAVDKASISILPGQSVGLVGESGCGKSSLARAIVGLAPAVSGHVILDGRDVTNARGASRRFLRRRVQLVFQDPYSSLNPRMSIGEAIDEATRIRYKMSRSERSDEAARLLKLVRLDSSVRDRYPHEFSGGERQRIAIARALAAGPEVLVLDEVTSALDVSVQASILNLLRELQTFLNVSYLLISHNLAVVKYLCSSIAVMYMGRVFETAPRDALFSNPRHPYTKTLIDSVPRLQAHHNSGSVIRPIGEIPDPRQPPSGCRFRTRCPVGPLFDPSRVRCIEIDPRPDQDSVEHPVACHFPLN